jgi:metallo-beta-lactamase family protein
MELRFCGAAREVTGSSHLLTLDDGFTILLDCGMYQGDNAAMHDFNENWLFDPEKINCVILSHAHIDHSGRLPKLYKDGFRGPIYTTAASQSLCTIMLMDSAKIQEQDAADYHKVHARDKKKGHIREPLYTQKDVVGTLRQFTGIPYHRWSRIHPNVELYLRDAGHILGSASITLRIKRKKDHILLGFTGDIGRKNRPILRDPQPMQPVDYLICESTYGNRLHEEKPAEEDRFLRIMRETCVDNKGKLIIPAFSIGKTQELLHMMNMLQADGRLPEIPVFVDSPLSTSATEIYALHPECYDQDLLEFLITDPNPFGFRNLTFTRSVQASKALNEREGPCVIISASGMMNAGRIQHHMVNNIEDARNCFLIVGFCAPGTQGHYLRNGSDKVRVFDRWWDVKARVEVMDSFSAHADRDEMRDFLAPHRDKNRELFLVHGLHEVQQRFAEVLVEDGFRSVNIPSLDQRVPLEF